MAMIQLYKIQRVNVGIFKNQSKERLYEQKS